MSAIGAISAAASGIGATAPTAATPTAASAATSGAGSGFGNAVVDALEQIQQSQANVDNLAVKAATGDLQDAHEFMIAATQASLSTEMAIAVRNRAVEAFTSVMQMGV